MTILRDQKGASHIVAIVGVLVIAVVAFVGYRVLNNTTPTASSSTPAVSTNLASSTTPAQIKNAADLKKAANDLSSTSIDGAVNPNSLDNDLSALQQ